MVESTDSCVALFIDWDNLAISIAADMNGATPDVKTIVHKAQEYGRILIARAYAEWNTMSERLSVYRAGVEPVYAPTFRFETDPVTQLSRGKSLADPVMVADCIDTLHLMPQISTYVVVSGDKDLIPVVRLAQLRGRRVVVIGPDFVAAVLKDMADDFVSYRTLVQAETAEIPALAPSRRREAPAPRKQPSRGGRSQTAQAAKAAAVTTPAAVAEEAELAAEPAAELPDLSEVFTSLVEILKQMAAAGRSRVRATNLKDQLLVRLPGFSERKYAFSKFKDLLMAAERNGLLKISAAGPVHWVSLPPAEVEVQAPEVVAPAPVVQKPVEVEIPAVVESPEEVARKAEEAHQRRLAVISFIDELRHRSRWLTYTYVLTNVIGFIGRFVPPGEAESEARSILNYLVGEGALRVDKIPQEVDVGGIKHRVRMCHFVDENPLVIEARASHPERETAEPTAEAGEQPAEEQPSFVQATVGQEPVERPTTPAGEPSLELGEVEAGPTPREREEATPEAEALAEEIKAEPEEVKAAPSRSRRPRRRPKASQAQKAEAEAEAEGQAPQPQAEEEQAEEPKGEEAKATPSEREEPAAEEEARPSLDEVFAKVHEILTTSAEQGKTRVTGSSLKLRLSRAYGKFDERQYGFSKFKDFLHAAEQAGCAQVNMEGQVSWVRLPQAAAEEAPAAVEPVAEEAQTTSVETPAEAAEAMAEAEPQPAAEAAPVESREEAPAEAAPEEPSEGAGAAEETAPSEEQAAAVADEPVVEVKPSFGEESENPEGEQQEEELATARRGEE
ncbi:MAG: NYN domain-containing protein [Chloroflexota bacterium]